MQVLCELKALASRTHIELGLLGLICDYAEPAECENWMFCYKKAADGETRCQQCIDDFKEHKLEMRIANQDKPCARCGNIDCLQIQTWCENDHWFCHECFVRCYQHECKGLEETKPFPFPAVREDYIMLSWEDFKDKYPQQFPAVNRWQLAMDAYHSICEKTKRSNQLKIGRCLECASHVNEWYYLVDHANHRHWPLYEIDTP